MALHVRFASGATAGPFNIRAQQVTSGNWFDFVNLDFVPSPTTPSIALAAAAVALPGLWTLDIASTPVATWTDGEYLIAVDNGANSIAALSAIFVSGDTAPINASFIAGSVFNALTASYNSPNSFGAALQPGGAFTGVLAANGLDNVVVTSKNGVTINARQALRYGIARIGNLDESIPGHSRFIDPITGDLLIDAGRSASGFTSTFMAIA